MLRGLLLALLLLVPVQGVADDDDAGTLDSPGLRGGDDEDDDEDDEPPDEPTDEDIDEYWQEDEDGDEREELLGVRDDESAGRMQELDAAAEREAEDAGEPEDIFADPDKPSPDDPYAENDEPDDEEDPFAEVTKDPYGGSDDSDTAERDPDDAGEVGNEPALPDVLRDDESEAAPVLGSPLEDDDADGTP